MPSLYNVIWSRAKTVIRRPGVVEVVPAAEREQFERDAARYVELKAELFGEGLCWYDWQFVRTLPWLLY